MNTTFFSNANPYRFLIPITPYSDNDPVTPSHHFIPFQTQFKQAKNEQISVEQLEFINKKKQLVASLLKYLCADRVFPVYFQKLSYKWIIQHEFLEIFLGFEKKYLTEEEIKVFCEISTEIKNWYKNLPDKISSNEIEKCQQLCKKLVKYLTSTKRLRKECFKNNVDIFIKKIEFIKFYIQYFEYINFSELNKSIEINNIDDIFCSEIIYKTKILLDKTSVLAEKIGVKNNNQSIDPVTKKLITVPNAILEKTSKEYRTVKSNINFTDKKITKIKSNFEKLKVYLNQQCLNHSFIFSYIKDIPDYLDKCQNTIELITGPINNDLITLKSKIYMYEQDQNQQIIIENNWKNEKINRKLKKLMQPIDDDKKLFQSFSNEEKLTKINELKTSCQQLGNLNNLITEIYFDLGSTNTTLHLWLAILEEEKEKSIDLDWRSFFKYELEEEKIQKIKAKCLFKKQNKKLKNNCSEIDVDLQKTQLLKKLPKTKKSIKTNEFVLEKEIFTTFFINELELKIKNIFEKSTQDNLSIRFHQAQAAGKDVRFHLKNLGCLIDIHSILQLKNISNRSELLKKRIFSSVAVMLEQYLSAKILQENQEAELTHNHVFLANSLKSKEFEQKVNQYLPLLKAINEGCIISRYPNQICLFNKGKLPEGIWELFDKKSEDSMELNTLPIKAIAFLDDVYAKKIEVIFKEKLLDEKNIIEPTYKLKICEQANEIIQTCIKAYQAVESIKNQHIQEKDDFAKRKVAICKDILWHLEGLKDSMEVLQTTPQTRFLFSHGHSILNHLQLMIELILKLKIAEKNGTIKNSHDLGELFLLVEDNEKNDELNSQQNENKDLIDFLEDLNLSYGAHYPYRRLESIRVYNSRLTKNYVDVPNGLNWRIEAKKLSEIGDMIDLGMNRTNTRKKMNSQTQVNTLYEKLFSWSTQALSFTFKYL